MPQPCTDTRATHCFCGLPTVLEQHVRYSYPRAEYVPQAMDPWRVHGGGYCIRTCGNPQCNLDSREIADCRVRIIDDSVLVPHAWLSNEQIDGLELEIAP